MLVDEAARHIEKLILAGNDFIRSQPQFSYPPLEQRIQFLGIYVDGAVRLLTKQA